MTARERFLAAVRGEAVDRVPLCLEGFNTPAARWAEMEDPLRREVAERLGERMHYAVNVPGGGNRMLMTDRQYIHTRAERLSNGHRRTTGTIQTPKGELTFIQEYAPEVGTPWQVKYPVETKQDVQKIASVPWEAPPPQALPDPGDLPADYATRGILRTGVSSPMVCVGGMMPYQQFLEWCATDLPMIRELTDLCLRRIMDVLASTFAAPGVEYLWMGGSEWLTPPMASPKLYDELVQEQERQIIDYAHAHGAVVHVHCHGGVRDALPKTIARGADYTEPVEPPPDGDITMAEAKALAAGRMTLGGNVECRMLCNEPADVVEAATRAAFAGGKHRFVLTATAGPSPRMSRREFDNYMRMIDLWEELSIV